jgi:hypothetical protein
MGRREFLLLASGTAVAAVAFGGQHILPVPTAAGSSLSTFSLGYLDPRSVDLDGNVRVSSAAVIPSGDGSLISGGARVAILGANLSKSSQRDKILLDVKFPVWTDGAWKPISFQAWSYDRTTATTSNSVSFYVPLDAQQRLTMSLATRTAASSPKAVSRREILSVAPSSTLDEVPVVLSITSETGSMKLRRGYYFIAPLMTGEKEPNWASLQTHPDKGYKLYDGSTPADFDYIILHVEAAPIDEPTRDRAVDKRK